METRVDHNKITISYWKLEQAWSLSRVLISLDPMVLTWSITYPNSNHALFYFFVGGSAKFGGEAKKKEEGPPDRRVGLF